MKNIICIVALCIFFVVGCSSKKLMPVSSNSSVPDWVYNPSSNDYIGGVGVCGTHIKGKNAQRELAISRAIEEIARQKGVTVSNVLSTSSKSNSSSSLTSNMSSYSVHTVTGEVINAFIVDTWINQDSNELYIYMQERLNK